MLQHFGYKLRLNISESFSDKFRIFNTHKIVSAALTISTVRA